LTNGRIHAKVARMTIQTKPTRSGTKGNGNRNVGRKHSLATRKKMSASQKARFASAGRKTKATKSAPRIGKKAPKRRAKK
jgi:hypothetical protein